MHLKCGYICCLHCIQSVRKEPYEEGLLYSFCPVVSQRGHQAPAAAGELVSKVKELEPHPRVILQMNPRMLKFPVDMTLDVDTANEFLIISDNLRSVQGGTIKQKLKDSAERFSYFVYVLGSSGFTSGHHYWEADTGINKGWDLGIYKESVHRKRKSQLSTELGFWTLSLRKGSCYWAHTTLPTALHVNSCLHKVGVLLDMDIGNISFGNISDGSHIFTFTKISASKPLRPFFRPSKPSKGDKVSLRICPVMNPNNLFSSTTQEGTVKPTQ